LKKERKEDSFIKQPYYKGGDKAIQAFIASHLRYPASSLKNAVEGDVQIRYTINHKGEIIDTQIIGGLDDACNEEAVRVVRLLKFEVPKTPRKIKVLFHKNIRIHFRLPVAKPQPSQNSVSETKPPRQSFSYSMTAEVQKQKPAQGKTYSYTIKIN
jgi:TonB family protein